MSVSIANETLLAYDSYVNKNVKDMQLFWNKLWIVCGNRVIGIFAAWQHPVELTELCGNKQEFETISRSAALLWKCAHYFGREAETVAMRLI